jgi:hypothetical protein
MAFFGRFNDKCVRQLLLGFARPLVSLQSEEFRVAVQRSFGLPLAVLMAHVGERIRNNEKMPRLVRSTVRDGGHRRRDAHLTRRVLGRSGALAQGGWNQVQRRRAFIRPLQEHLFVPYACLRGSRRNGAEEA